MGPLVIKMKTIRNLFQVERHEINYIKLTIESYDGTAVVRTIDPFKAIIELQISPGCETLVFELLESLKECEGIRILPVKLGDY